jgi:hypothetical protein
MVRKGLVEPGFLGIIAFPAGLPTFKHWWEWTLAAVIAASALVGIFAGVWYSYHSLRKLLKVNKTSDVAEQSTDCTYQVNHDENFLPRSVQERIHLLSRSASEFRKKHTLAAKPTSFGVYLGMLHSPITVEEAEILAQWDAVILDYCEPGVLDAVNDDSNKIGPHIIARIDLLQILSSKVGNSEVDLSRVVYILSKIIRQTLRQPHQRRYFTGVVVAGWAERLSTPLLNGVARLLAAYGLDVYLEVGPPYFLDGVEKLDIGVFAGVIVRNGTIMTDGNRRDYFEMDKMKTTTKAFVSQACQRPFLTMMWDTIDDEVDLSHAVVRRAHMWCSYHGAIPYFTRRQALTSIFDIRSCEEPLAAFQWLKTRRVMTVHDKYRTTRTVSNFFLHVNRSRVPDNQTALSGVFECHRRLSPITGSISTSRRYSCSIGWRRVRQR